MSMGFGHNYWVELLGRKEGTFDECVEFARSCSGGVCDIHAEVRFDKKKKKCYFTGLYICEHLKMS